MGTLMRKIGSWSIILAVFSFLLGACGGPSKITVSMTVHELALSAPSAKPGEITFHVKNDANLQPHNFVVIKTDLSADSLPIGADAFAMVDESQFQVLGKIEAFGAGESRDLTLTLDAGHYVLICNVEGHYAQRMYADFTVAP